MSNYLQPHGMQHPNLPVLHYLPKFAQTYVCWNSDVIQTSHPLLPPSPPAFTLYQQQCIFQWVSCLHQVAKVFIGVSASASLLPVNIQCWLHLVLTGLISLRFKGLKNFLQNYNLKTSILQCSSFFMVQLSHLYMTTWKAITLIIQTFVSKVMSLILNILSRIVRVFLPRTKCLLTSWLQ